MAIPQLLVSVRSPEEAVRAVTGGAGILDVKEPAAGPLGMATFDAIRRISHALAGLPEQPPLSLALGELRDWFSSASVSAATADNARQALRDFLRELPALRFLKCGLAGCREFGDWQAVWAELRSVAGPQVAWVAVAYADAERAASPDVRQVLSAASAAGARVVLIDTFIKDHTRLLDWLPPDQLREVGVICRQSGLLLALAGQVTAADFPLLQQVGADVIAVRGAACAGADRMQAISEQRVRELVGALRALG